MSDDVSEKHEQNTTQRVRVPRGTAPDSRGACLVVIAGERLGQRIDLHDVPVVIGRAPHCDVQIEHRSVSRLHCKVWHDEGRFFVRDLGSTNHTLVNERAAEQTELKDGDRVSVGEIVFKFVRRGSPEARYHEALYELATVDSLTQLYNRRKFREFLEAACARARTEMKALTLAFVDLDHFKAINDRHGHIAGDEVLRKVAGAIRGALRPQDIGGRLGGEEFAIVMPETDVVDAVGLAERYRRLVSELEFEINGQRQRVTASIGVAPWRSGYGAAAELMREADLQLFRAKAAGRDRVCAPDAG